MDIEYLLFLQALRETAPQWINAFLSFVSEVAVSPANMLVPAIFYWAINKKDGEFLLLGTGLARSFNSLIKNIACVYRPWIRDPRVKSSLMKTATGYSFPSGHSALASAGYGGVGAVLSRKKKWLFAVLLIPCFITMFARNWVGAHTPQDVLVGFCSGMFSLWVVSKILKYIEAHPEHENRIVLIALIATAAALAFQALKSYPMDVGADGKLLADPKSMLNDTFIDTGVLFGGLIGWWFERKFIRFEIKGTTMTKVLRCLIGAALFYLICLEGYKHILIMAFSDHWGRFAVGVNWSLFITVIYPFLFSSIEKMLANKSKES